MIKTEDDLPMIEVGLELCEELPPLFRCRLTHLSTFRSRHYMDRTLREVHRVQRESGTRHYQF